jgi:hypothetical protein
MHTLPRLLFITILFRMCWCDTVCKRCGTGSYDNTPDLQCDTCNTSTCTECSPSKLPQFGLWGADCNMTGCRGGYTAITDATDTIRCVKMNEGHWDKTDDAIYLDVFKWPPSLAYANHRDNAPFIATTGKDGNADCAETPIPCRKDERSIPCTFPLGSYCIPCSKPISGNTMVNQPP